MLTAPTIPQNANPVFDRTYFVLFHVLAWIVYAVVYYVEVIRWQKPADYWQVVALATISGSLICWALALTYQRVRHRNLVAKIAVVVVACLIMGSIWTLIKGVFYNYWYATDSTNWALIDVGGVLQNGNALLFWSALYLVYDNYNLAIQNQIQALQAHALARENQLKVLSYQLNPHFMFNVLNSISTLVLKGNNTAAHQTIVKLAEFLRYSLFSKPWKKVSLDQEIECIKQYLDIQLVRFQERLRVVYDIPTNLRLAMLPNLILQPIVENSIKHTISHSAKSVDILIVAKIFEHKLHVCISNTRNNLQNHDQQKMEHLSNGIGLINVRDRLAAYYEDRAELRIQSLDTSYVVTLCIPFEVEQLKSKGKAK